MSNCGELSGNARGGMGMRSSTSTTSYRNMGETNPRLPQEVGPEIPDLDFEARDDAGALPLQRAKRNKIVPSHRRLMFMLSMAVVPEERAAFRQRFRDAKSSHDSAASLPSRMVGATPLGWIASAYECEPYQLTHARDMFPTSRIESEFLNEFYILDVILNRALKPINGNNNKKKGGAGKRPPADYNVVRPVLAYKEIDLSTDFDIFYRAVILFLPQSGIFYCHRERRHGDVGKPGTFLAHDMSWLRLQKKSTPPFQFGSDGYVKCFYDVGEYECRVRNRTRVPRPYVTAWRISMRKTDPVQAGFRTIYRAIQCKDSEGPMVPPDVVSGWDVDGVSVESRRAQYNKFLAKANSAKQHGRHYVDGCHHYRLPDACWIIDPEETPYVDIWIDITDEDNGSGARNRQSVVMIRNVLSMPESPDVNNAMLLEGISSTLAAFRKSESTSAARGKTNDYGRMVPIGTRVPETGRGTLPFAANKHFREHTLRNLVANLASVGRQCFPQVYAGIRDVEGDSGLAPVQLMNGLPAKLSRSNYVDDFDEVDRHGDDDGGDHDLYCALRNASSSHIDGDEAEDACGDQDDVAMKADAAMIDAAMKSATTSSLCNLGGDETPFSVGVHEAILSGSEGRARVGYTIDMSINLGNSSHFDVNDASQGYSVWTEDFPGTGKNWYFVMPNVYGHRYHKNRQDDALGRGRYEGVAVKLGHGVAISWDGRLIRHCTSISHPDGMDVGRVGTVGNQKFTNHLYGTFTAAKEKIVRAGRYLSAEKFSATNRKRNAQGDDNAEDEGVEVVRKKKRRKDRKKRGKLRTKSDVPLTPIVTINVSDGNSGGGTVLTVCSQQPAHVSPMATMETSVPRKRRR